MFETRRKGVIAKITAGRFRWTHGFVFVDLGGSLPPVRVRVSGLSQTCSTGDKASICGAVRSSCRSAGGGEGRWACHKRVCVGGGVRAKGRGQVRVPTTWLKWEMNVLCSRWTQRHVPESLRIKVMINKHYWSFMYTQPQTKIKLHSISSFSIVLHLPTLDICKWIYESTLWRLQAKWNSMSSN